MKPRFELPSSSPFDWAYNDLCEAMAELRAGRSVMAYKALERAKHGMDEGFRELRPQGS